MRLFIFLTNAVLLSGCAATYEIPQMQPAIVFVETTAPKSQVIATAQKVLASEGFEIISADEASGTVSTATRSYPLYSEEANCGTTMGLDYLEDNRTWTGLAYSVIADDGRLTVRALISGEYRPGERAWGWERLIVAFQDITLTCVSRGILEREMLSKIIAALPR